MSCDSLRTHSSLKPTEPTQKTLSTYQGQISNKSVKECFLLYVLIQRRNSKKKKNTKKNSQTVKLMKSLRNHHFFYHNECKASS